MRASQTGQRASIGVNAVWTAFDQLGWGATENSRHDLGTDLFVQARDARLYDLGLVIGVQVKAGASYFKEPARPTESTPAGWWFRDRDKEHTDYWLSHGLPHLLVLHDYTTRECYWAHVTADAVVDTGKGAKILVPAANTIDVAHRDELLAIAGTGRRAVPLEGTAWHGAMPAAVRDRLRFALLVPRLVAPHPNAAREKAITPPEAVALLMQARLSELAHYAERFRAVPTLRKAARSRRWPWRFVGALGDRIIYETLDTIRAVRADAPDAAARAAATVVLAHGLIADGDASGALAVLDAALAADDAAPVDDAWLRLQRARALVEVGRVEEAREQALAVQTVRTVAPDDVTATAISGVAAALLFNTASLDDRSVGSWVEGVDTVVAWWRTQTTSRGVAAIVQRTFDAWAGDESWSTGPDEANNQLYVAGLSAGHLGDQGSWRRMAMLLGRNALLRLDRHATVEAAADGLNALRLAGDEKALAKAAGKLIADGPALAVRQAAAAVDLPRATSTTIFADLALCEHAGDLFDPDAAAAAADWILATIKQPDAFLAITGQRWFRVEAKLIEVLSGLAGVVPDTAITALVDRLPTLANDDDVVVGRAWVKLVYAIPQEAWTAAAARAVAPYARPDAQGVGSRLLEMTSQFDPDARVQLRAAVAGGSLRALALWGDVTTLPVEVVPQVFSGLAAELAKRRDAAGQHVTHFYVDDAGRALVIMLANYPNQDGLDTLKAYLLDGAVSRSAKRPAIAAIADSFARLQPTVAAELAATVQTAANLTSPLDNSPSADPDITAEAACVAALAADNAADRMRILTKLLSGSPRHRRWAALLAARDVERDDQPASVGVIATLSADADPSVRAWAAAMIASLVAADRGGALARTALRQAAADPGRAMPAAIVSALEAAEATSRTAVETLESLREHPSSEVRRTVAVALAPARLPAAKADR